MKSTKVKKNKKKTHLPLNKLGVKHTKHKKRKLRTRRRGKGSDSVSSKRLSNTLMSNLLLNTQMSNRLSNTNYLSNIPMNSVSFVNNSNKNKLSNNIRAKNTSNPEAYNKARKNFNKLREEIKASKNIRNTMFRFGMPSQLINDFIYSLYNENIVRVITHSKLQTNMMSSIVELKNEPNTIYITISEEPNTDPEFYNKIGSLLQMIENILFKTDFRGKILGEGYKYENGNHSYANNKIILLDIDENDVRNISKTSQYRTNYRNNWRTTFDTKKTRNTFKYLFNPEKSSKDNHNDYRNLVSDITVKFVFNNKYINERRPSLGPVYNNKSKSFKPFLKRDKNFSNHEDLVACNSGSICSESKIFSYLHDHNLFNQSRGTPNIKGAIAYWIGKSSNFGKECEKKGKQSVSKCNYHPNYAYTENNENDYHLETMLKILNSENKISSNLSNKMSTNLNISKNIFRPYALPCPGCFLNKDAYKNNTREFWSSHQCIENNKDKISRIKQNEMLKKAAEAHPSDESELRISFFNTLE